MPSPAPLPVQHYSGGYYMTAMTRAEGLLLAGAAERNVVLSKRWYWADGEVWALTIKRAVEDERGAAGLELHMDDYNDVNGGFTICEFFNTTGYAPGRDGQYPDHPSTRHHTYIEREGRANMIEFAPEKMDDGGACLAGILRGWLR